MQTVQHLHLVRRATRFTLVALALALGGCAIVLAGILAMVTTV